MKKWIVAIGGILFLLGLRQGIKYLFDYNSLTNYGKGYVWGSILLLILGLSLVVLGIRNKK